MSIGLKYYQLLWLCCGGLLYITACTSDVPQEDIISLSEYDKTPLPTATIGDKTTFSSPIETPDMPSFSVEITDTNPITVETDSADKQEIAVQSAISDLSTQLGIPKSQIVATSIEAVEWSDSSLGCPQEGYMYAQVITPGFLITLQTNNQTYTYHTDTRGTVVLCES